MRRSFRLNTLRARLRVISIKPAGCHACATAPQAGEWRSARAHPTRPWASSEPLARRCDEGASRARVLAPVGAQLERHVPGGGARAVELHTSADSLTYAAGVTDAFQRHSSAPAASAPAEKPRTRAARRPRTERPPSRRSPRTGSATSPPRPPPPPTSATRVPPTTGSVALQHEPRAHSAMRAAHGSRRASPAATPHEGRARPDLR